MQTDHEHSRALLSDTVAATADYRCIHRSLDVYNILALPRQVTSEIFMFHVAAHAGVAGDTSPLRLTRVCRDWRNIALNLNALWNRIYIDEPSFCRQDNAVQRIRFWMDNAGDFPLDVRIDWQYSPLLSCILGILDERAFRLKRLDLKSKRPLSTLQGMAGKLASLITLDVQSDQRLPISGFAVAPRLRHVHLTHLTQREIMLPWDQLTSLMLRKQKFGVCLEILSRTQLLRRLRIYPEIHDTFVGPHPIITLPGLRSMDAYGVSGQMLDHLTLPHLIHLECGSPQFKDVMAIPRLVQRSGCKVETLHLHVTDKDEIFQCMIALPGLRELNLTTPCIDENEMKDLLVELGRGAFPALTSLSLTSVDIPLDIGYLAAMLQARTNASPVVARITSLHVDFIEQLDFSGSVHETMDNLRSEYALGLTFTIHGAPWYPTNLLDAHMALEIGTDQAA